MNLIRSLILTIMIVLPIRIGIDYSNDIKIANNLQSLVRYKIRKLEKSAFTYNNFLKYLKVVGLYNDTIIKQAILETGWFSSKSFIVGNNLFGMKVVYNRPTTSDGEFLLYAKYSHWTQSIQDFKLFLEYYKVNLDSDNYYDFLKRIGYAESEEYLNILTNIKLIK